MKNYLYTYVIYNKKLKKYYSTNMSTGDNSLWTNNVIKADNYDKSEIDQTLEPDCTWTKVKVTFEVKK